MAGAQKNRQRKERKNEKSSSSGDKNQTSSSSGNGKSPPSGQNISPPSRMDGNRDPEAARPRGNSTAGVRVSVNRNIDVGGALANVGAGMVAANLPKRPAKQNTSGKELMITLNTFKVEQFPTQPVYQFEVTIGNGAEKRVVHSKVWASKTLQAAIGPGWIYDGSRLAWSLRQPANKLQIINVDLDEEEGKESKGRNKFKVVLNFTNNVKFDTLRAYLNHQSDKGEESYASVSFLDHLMRQRPGENLTSFRRSFFARGQTRHNLGGGIEAFKGVYASVALVNYGAGQAAGLSVNVDVANSAFWTAQPLLNAIGQQSNAPNPQQLSAMLRPTAEGKDSFHFLNLKRFKKLAVTVAHLPGRSFIIDRFLRNNANEEKLTTPEGRTMTIRQYFANKTPPINLQHPNLPLVQMTKKVRGSPIKLPVELCNITQNQRYQFKLSDKQTTEMIKFAVTLPKERWDAVQHGLKLLDWQNDQYLQQYGMRISTQPTVVKARLLPNPKVQFAGTGPNASVNPGQSGRWDLRNKRFIEPHPKSLKSWGWCILPDRSGRPCVSEEQLKTFIKMFIQTFTGHGGRVENQQPAILSNMTSNNAAAAVEGMFNSAGNQAKAKPQILFFIVPDKDASTYGRIKKSTDCRFGLVSQCLQSAHVAKCQQQYASNVCMKVNAKLGGATAKAVGMRPAGWFSKPTMVIGIDVTHGSPETANVAATPSIAAITMSWDRAALKYIAAVQTNGFRQELVSRENVKDMMGPMVDNWVKNVAGGNFPQHIIVLRDGVSEGQYSQVLDTEVDAMKELLRSKAGKTDFKMTFLVASKRHHIRFFPKQGSGDKNGNPQPGTLVETGVTQPREYDFYLNSHSAIKGTARPVHYQVLLDEADMPVTDLQNMLYEHSYQYVRSTTPVSLYPAVYYAHLAAARALPHYDAPSVSSSDKETITGSSNRDKESKPLLALGNDIRATMWFV